MDYKLEISKLLDFKKQGKRKAVGFKKKEYKKIKKITEKNIN